MRGESATVHGVIPLPLLSPVQRGKGGHPFSTASRGKGGVYAHLLLSGQSMSLVFSRHVGKGQSSPCSRVAIPGTLLNPARLSRTLLTGFVKCSAQGACGLSVQARERALLHCITNGFTNEFGFLKRGSTSFLPLTIHRCFHRITAVTCP